MILLIGLAALTAFSFYVYYLSRSVFFGWASLLLVQLYEYSFGISQVNAGGIHLDIVDVVSLGLLLAGVIRTTLRLRERNTARMIGLGYLAVFALSLIRGTVSNGAATAANEARGFVPILISILYFLTAPVDAASMRRYIRLYFYYGLGFVIVALLAYGGLHIGGAAWLHSRDVAINTIEDRLLPAAAALGLGFCFVYSLAWFDEGRGNLLFRWLPAIFLGTTLFLRHRSVFNALLFGVAALLILDNRLVRRLLPMAAVSLVVIAAFAVVASTTAAPEDDATASTGEGLSQDVTNQGTLVWRLQVWASVLTDKEQTPLTIALGKGLGEGYVTLNPAAGHWINVPPHSEYIVQFARVGVIGSALMLAFVIRPLMKFWSLATTDKLAVEPSVSAWVALLVGAIVYGLTYTIPPDTFALVGIACAAIASRDAEKVRSRAVIVPKAVLV